MGTLIKMVSVARPYFRFSSGNSIRLAVRAARQCIENAGIDPRDLGLVINTGVYRHKNTGEPAIAALIQQKISSVKTYRNNSDSTKNTFSFDINNGGCGLLTGIEIVHSLLANREISYGMTVTADTEPFHGLSVAFDYNAASAAIILSSSDKPAGFSLFRTYSFPEYSEELISKTSYSKPGRLSRGKNILNVVQKDTYPGICVDCAEKSLLDFLQTAGLSPDKIDLIIPSQSPSGFTDKLKERLDCRADIIEMNNKGRKVFHTAGPAFALKKAWDDNRFSNSKNIIFLTIGSGINVSLALYKN